MSIPARQDDRYFRTSSFYTAAYLYTKDCELINVDKTIDPKRAQFVFINNPQLDILVDIFNFASLIVFGKKIKGFCFEPQAYIFRYECDLFLRVLFLKS